jgi:hypothetical protein
VLALLSLATADDVSSVVDDVLGADVATLVVVDVLGIAPALVDNVVTAVCVPVVSAGGTAATTTSSDMMSSAGADAGIAVANAHGSMTVTSLASMPAARGALSHNEPSATTRCACSSLHAPSCTYTAPSCPLKCDIMRAPATRRTRQHVSACTTNTHSSQQRQRDADRRRVSARDLWSRCADTPTTPHYARAMSGATTTTLAHTAARHGHRCRA